MRAIFSDMKDLHTGKAHDIVSGSVIKVPEASRFCSAVLRRGCELICASVFGISNLNKGRYVQLDIYLSAIDL